MAEATLGNLVYFIRAQNESFKQKIKETENYLKGIGVTFDKGKKQAQDYGKSLTSSLDKIRESIQKHKETLQSLTISAGIAFTTMTMQIKRSVKEMIVLQNSLAGLSSVAKAFKQDVNAANKAAQDLAADGLMGVSDAATSLKNLLASGFNLEQAIQLMTRFKDIAAFNRQASLGFGEAIRGATEGIKNGNSILVDNIGLTKNLSLIMKEAGYSEQDVMRVTSDLNVRMAMFNGLIKETNPYVGDAGKLAEMLSGQLTKTEENIRKLYRALGSTIEGPVTGFLKKVNEILEKTTEWINKNKELAGTLTIIATGTTGAVLGISAMVLAVDKLLGIVKSAVAIIAGSRVASYVAAVKAARAGSQAAASAINIMNASILRTITVATSLTAVLWALNAAYNSFKDFKAVSMKPEEIKNIQDITKAYQIQASLQKDIARMETEINKMETGGGLYAAKRKLLPGINDEDLKFYKEQLNDLKSKNKAVEEVITSLLGGKGEDAQSGVDSNIGSGDKKSAYRLAKARYEADVEANEWSLEEQNRYWRERLSNVKKSTLEEYEYLEKLAQLRNELEAEQREISDKLALERKMGFEKELLSLEQSMDKELEGVEKGSQRDINIRERYRLQKDRLIRQWNLESEAQQLELNAAIADAQSQFEQAEINRENARHKREISDSYLTNTQLETLEKQHLQNLLAIRDKYTNERAALNLSMKEAEIVQQIAQLENQKSLVSLHYDNFTIRNESLQIEKQIVELQYKKIDLQIAELERQEKIAKEKKDELEVLRLETEILQLRTQKQGIQFDFELSSKKPILELQSDLKGGISSAIQAGFNDHSALSAADSFVDYLKNKLRTNVADALAGAIMNSSFGNGLQSIFGSIFGGANSSNTGYSLTNNSTGSNTSSTAVSGLGNLFKSGSSAGGTWGKVAGIAGGVLAGSSMNDEKKIGLGATAGSLIGSIWGPVGSMVGGIVGGVVDSLFGGSSKEVTVQANHGVLNSDYASANFKEITLPSSYLSSSVPSSNAVAPVFNITNNITAKNTIVTQDELDSHLESVTRTTISKVNAESKKWQSLTTTAK